MHFYANAVSQVGWDRQPGSQAAGKEVDQFAASMIPCTVETIVNLGEIRLEGTMQNK